MTEQAFASVWGLSYLEFEFLSWYGAKSSQKGFEPDRVYRRR